MVVLLRFCFLFCFQTVCGRILIYFNSYSSKRAWGEQKGKRRKAGIEVPLFVALRKQTDIADPCLRGVQLVLVPPGVLRVPERHSDSDTEVVFPARLPAMGYTSFLLTTKEGKNHPYHPYLPLHHQTG